VPGDVLADPLVDRIRVLAQDQPNVEAGCRRHRDDRLAADTGVARVQAGDVQGRVKHQPLEEARLRDRREPVDAMPRLKVAQRDGNA
jgi:hypothetical protein